jgi:hypothetical protein
MLQVIFNNIYQCLSQYDRTDYTQSRKSQGYTPTVDQILRSTSLSIREKNDLLELYHGKTLNKVKASYYVEKNRESQRDRYIREISDLLIDFTKRDPDTINEIVKRVVDAI